MKLINWPLPVSEILTEVKPRFLKSPFESTHFVQQLFGLPLSESCGRNLIPPFLSAGNTLPLTLRYLTCLAFQRFFNLLAEETSIIHPASIFMSSNDSHVLSLTKEALEAGNQPFFLWTQ